MAECPCGRKIDSWEAVCSNCWGVLGKHDQKYGSSYRKDVVKRFQDTGRRDMIDQEILAILKKRIVPEKTLQMMSLKRKVRAHCIKCEEENGKKDIDDCFSCPYHHMFNKMLHEILQNGHGWG